MIRKMLQERMKNMIFMGVGLQISQCRAVVFRISNSESKALSNLVWFGGFSL